MNYLLHKVVDIMDENNIIHKELLFKPDKDGFKIEINLINKPVAKVVKPVKVEKKPKENIERVSENS